MIKVIYRHNTLTKEIEDNLPDNWTWMEKQFYTKYIQLDLDEDEPYMFDDDWLLKSFLCPDVLVFRYNLKKYINYK